MLSQARQSQASVVQVAEQTAAARQEAELAAAAVAGLAFEDKLKLLTALQPESLAALVGMHSASPEATVSDTGCACCPHDY